MKPKIKLRNCAAIAMRGRSGAGAHGKTRKAERRLMKVAIRKDLS
jgi:hypothetical protein